MCPTSKISVNTQGMSLAKCASSLSQNPAQQVWDCGVHPISSHIFTSTNCCSISHYHSSYILIDTFPFALLYHTTSHCIRSKSVNGNGNPPTPPQSILPNRKHFPNPFLVQFAILAIQKKRTLYTLNTHLPYK